MLTLSGSFWSCRHWQPTSVNHSNDKWFRIFTDCFVNNVHTSIQWLDAWGQRPFTLSSATTNASESFKCLLNKICKIGKYYLSEIVRGLYSQGNYSCAVEWLKNRLCQNKTTSTDRKTIADEVRYSTLVTFQATPSQTSTLTQKSSSPLTSTVDGLESATRRFLMTTCLCPAKGNC